MHIHKFEFRKVAGIRFGVCKRCEKVRRYLYLSDMIRWYHPNKRFWELWNISEEAE